MNLKPGEKSKSRQSLITLHDRKQNASERINLQMIMELREKFEAADDDGNDGLDEVEVRTIIGS
jgi:enoyl-CoA hydratase/carnithine racemase